MQLSISFLLLPIAVATVSCSDRRESIIEKVTYCIDRGYVRTHEEFPFNRTESEHITRSGNEIIICLVTCGVVYDGT